jgi:hypothetical protein
LIRIVREGIVGDMQKTTLFAMSCLLGLTAIATAGGKEGSIGVGVESQVATTGGFDAGLDALSMNFDAGKFHVGGYLGIADPDGANNTLFGIGARFFYHIHASPMSDFGLGGSVGLLELPIDPGMMDHHYETHVFIEPSFQIRAFITPNVALSFTGGIVIGAADAAGVDLGGNLEGVAGIHYYFF